MSEMVGLFEPTKPRDKIEQLLNDRLTDALLDIDKHYIWEEDKELIKSLVFYMKKKKYSLAIWTYYLMNRAWVSFEETELAKNSLEYHKGQQTNPVLRAVITPKQLEEYL